MTNINTINKEKSELIKGLTAKEIRSALLNLWDKHYTTLLLKMNPEKADKILNQIRFIHENLNKDEWDKIDRETLKNDIEMMPIDIAIDLRFKNRDLGKTLVQTVLFSIYQNLETFNNMFSLINEDLNNLNNIQSLNLAIEIVSCRIESTVFNDKIISRLKPDNEIYDKFLKEKETFDNNINSTVFPEAIIEYMEDLETRINEKLEKEKSQ